jgi:hypothetical protein
MYSWRILWALVLFVHPVTVMIMIIAQATGDVWVVFRIAAIVIPAVQRFGAIVTANQSVNHQSARTAIMAVENAAQNASAARFVMAIRIKNAAMVHAIKSVKNRVMMERSAAQKKIHLAQHVLVLVAIVLVPRQGIIQMK